jgi:hypothetical protein
MDYDTEYHLLMKDLAGRQLKLKLNYVYVDIPGSYPSSSLNFCQAPPGFRRSFQDPNL